MPTATSSSPAPLPVPIAMSGAFAGSPLGVLPFGATFLGPHLQTGTDRGGVQITATGR